MEINFAVEELECEGLQRKIKNMDLSYLLLNPIDQYNKISVLEVLIDKSTEILSTVEQKRETFLGLKPPKMPIKLLILRKEIFHWEKEQLELSRTLNEIEIQGIIKSLKDKQILATKQYEELEKESEFDSYREALDLYIKSKRALKSYQIFYHPMKSLNDGLKGIKESVLNTFKKEEKNMKKLYELNKLNEKEKV